MDERETLMSPQIDWRRQRLTTILSHAMQNIDTTKEMVQKAYAKMEQRLQAASKRQEFKKDRKFTLAEKILFSHLHDPDGQELKPGESILALHPDRVAMQDA